MEAITNIDLNFTNSAGGHSASVSTILNPKNVQNGEDLGTIIGETGEVNVFSNPKISKMLDNFVCVEKTISTNPTSSTVSRKYTDRTTLVLKSHMVLVRGINCGPRDELEFEGEVPYFSEVVNSPKPLKDSFGRDFPFPSLEPRRYGPLIVAGKIYNYESASEYEGIKITLTYNDREFKPELSLNDEVVSNAYKESPDLSQYDLKFGYTLKEFKKILNIAGVGIAPNSDIFNEERGEKILFEQSGTLESVVGAVASYFGYFWYVDPQTGLLRFINTQEAITLKISDNSQTTDESVISSSFTESLTSTKIVNAYVGTAEKPEQKSPKDDDRARKVYFKRYDVVKDFTDPPLGRSDDEGNKYVHEELGALFALFNQNGGQRVFDQFFWLLLWENTAWWNKEVFKCSQWGMEIEGKGDQDYLNYTPLYLSGEPFNHQKWVWGPNPKNKDKGAFQLPAEGGGASTPVEEHPDNETRYIWETALEAEDLKKRKTTIAKNKLGDVFYDRLDDKFEYRAMNNKSPSVFGAGSKMRRPSETRTFRFLQSYFAIAGGVYVSHGYSKYKAERMEFQNMNNITIVGPFDGDWKLEDIDDLSELNDVLQLVGGGHRRTVRDLWKASHGKDQVAGAEPANDFHFIAIRNIPKLERKNGPNNDRLVDFKPFERLEVYDHSVKRGHLFLGGAGDDMKPFKFNDAVSLSYSNYMLAIKNKKSLGIKYVRSKTRVNKIAENQDEKDAEEEEDTEIAESDDSEQKMSDLFDRFDYKTFFVTYPKYDLLNNLSLSTFNGSVTEARALRKENESYAQEQGPTKNSSVTRYGLHIPRYKPQINSISIRFGAEGIETTVNESTIKLVPVNSALIENRAHESVFTENGLAAYLNASQKNFMGL